jgi:hypothetical protein
MLVCLLDFKESSMMGVFNSEASPSPLGNLSPGRSPTPSTLQEVTRPRYRERTRQYFLYIKNVKKYARPTTTIALFRSRFSCGVTPPPGSGHSTTENYWALTAHTTIDMKKAASFLWNRSHLEVGDPFKHRLQLIN